MALGGIAKLIQGSNHIVLMGHANGDSDCYGSLFALKLGLESIGKKVEIISTEEFPDSLNFLFSYFPGVISDSFVAEAELFIALDSSDVKRLVSPPIAEKYMSLNTKFIQLDHHSRGDIASRADYSFVDSEACATCEIVFNLLIELDAKIDRNIATCLLAGIIGDTSSFQNQNTTKECFAVSSELMKRGARLKVIVNNTFGGKEVDTLKVWGLAMERLYVNKKYGIVSTYLSYEDIEAFGLSPDAISGIVNFLNSIKDAKLVALITEEERGTIRVSLRTRDEHVDVASLARQFGGGGHVKAAGFSLPGSLNSLTEDGINHIVIV